MQFRNVYKMHMIAKPLGLLVALTLLSACSMGEEMRRIEATRQAQQASEAARSTNLTGEQIFIRSCNTCHPSGKLGMGPSLENMDTHFASDDDLKKMIRNGKGTMPPQGKSVLNEQELGSLVVYLRQLNKDLKESAGKK